MSIPTRYSFDPPPTVNRNRNGGFTLLELAITLVLLAILSLTAIPSMQMIIRSNQAATQANEILTALNYTRSEALKRARTVTLCASTDGQTCADSTELTAGILVAVLPRNTDEDVELLRDLQFAQGAVVVRARPATAPATVVSTITFTGDGRLQGNTALTIHSQRSNCRGTEARQIRITAVGQTTVRPTACLT